MYRILSSDDKIITFILNKGSRLFHSSSSVCNLYYKITSQDPRNDYCLLFEREQILVEDGIKHSNEFLFSLLKSIHHFPIY